MKPIDQRRPDPAGSIRTLRAIALLLALAALFLGVAGGSASTGIALGAVALISGVAFPLILSQPERRDKR